MRRWLLLLFLITMGVDWPQWPFNARFTDVAFAAAAVAILFQQRQWSPPRQNALDLAIIGYIAGSIPAVVFSPDQRTSAIELVRQLYLVAVYIAIAIAVRQGFARTVATGLALSGVVLVAIGLMAFVIFTVSGIGSPLLTPVMALPYIGDTARLSALTATPAMLACVLAMSLPFAALHPFVFTSRPRTIASTVMMGIGALLTFSHSIAGVAASGTMTAWRFIRSNVLIRAAAVALTVLIIVGLNFAASFAIRSIGSSSLRDNTVFQYGIDRGVARMFGVDVEYQTMSYLRIKQVAWDAFWTHPLFGLGLDRFHDATERAHAHGRLTDPYRTIDPHSTFLGRFAETGLFGGITLIGLWIAIGITVKRWTPAPDDYWIAAAAAAGLTGTLINTMNADVMNFRFLWAALGLVRGLQDQNPR